MIKNLQTKNVDREEMNKLLDSLMKKASSGTVVDVDYESDSIHSRVFGCQRDVLNQDDFTDVKVFITPSGKRAYYVKDYEINNKGKFIGSISVCCMNNSNLFVVYGKQAGKNISGYTEVKGVKKCVKLINSIISELVCGDFKGFKQLTMDLENNKHNRDGLSDKEVAIANGLERLVNKILEDDELVSNNKADSSGKIINLADLKPVRTYEISDLDVLSIANVRGTIFSAYDSLNDEYVRLNAKFYSSSQLESILDTHSEFYYFIIGSRGFLKQSGGRKSGFEFKQVMFWGDKLPNGEIGVRCPEFSKDVMSNSEFISKVILANITHITNTLGLNGHSGLIDVKSIDAKISLSNSTIISFLDIKRIDGYSYVYNGSKDNYRLDCLIKNIYKYVTYLLIVKSKWNLDKTEMAFKNSIANMCDYSKGIVTKLVNVDISKGKPVWELCVTDSSNSSIEESSIFIEYMSDELCVYREKGKSTKSLDSFVEKFKIAFGI